MASSPLRAALLTKSILVNHIKALRYRPTTSTSLLMPVRFASSFSRILDAFEDRCQRNERVLERDFVRTFDNFARVAEAEPKDPEGISTLTQAAALLLKCCGNLMFDTPPKGRELLAGNLWTFIKEKSIPMDISHYNSLLRVLNENNTTYDPQKILEEIKSQNLTPDRITYQRLIHQYCLQGDIAAATRLLEDMKNSEVELSESIFASLIIGYAKQETPPTVDEMFDLMRHNGIEPGSQAYVAALISLVDRFKKNPDSASKELTKIVDSLKQEEVLLSPKDQLDLVMNLGPVMNSYEPIANFFNENVDLNVSLGTKYKILTSFIRANQYDVASKLFWMQKVSDRTLQRGNLGQYYVEAISSNHNVPAEFVIDECTKLEEKGWNKNATYRAFRTAAESGRLDLVRACMKKIIEKEPLKVIFTWPLLAQAKNQDEVIRVLREDLNPKVPTSDLMETFSIWVWPKFENDVQKLFKANKELLKYETSLLTASYLNYSVQENKIEQAIKFIADMPQSMVNETNQTSEVQDDSDSDDDLARPTRQRQNDRTNLISKLLEQIAEQTKDPELVKKAYNMCCVPGQQMSNKSLAPLIKVHQLNSNFDKALAEFLEIVKEHRLTPCHRELMHHCLENKDPDNLQKIMSACTEIYGEQNSLFDLAICCLETNKLRQARKIFASPGFRVRPSRVYQACKQIARNENVEMLENYVNLVRDMYDVNQEFLYQILIDTYDRTSNAKRALKLWDNMQEEEFQPSKKSMVMIAELLEKNNIPVPFAKPKLNAQERATLLR